MTDNKLEVKDKRIAELEKQLHNEGAANAHAYERIRGLEAKLATPVRLPNESAASAMFDIFLPNRTQ